MGQIKIRNGSVMLSALRHMYFLQACWKTDFMLFLHSLYRSANQPALLYNKLISAHYIEEREVLIRKDRKKMGETKPAVYLTNEGRVALADKLENDHDYIMNNYEMITQAYHTMQEDILARRFSENRGVNMFCLSGATVYLQDKPSLYHLFYELLPEDDLEWEHYDVTNLQPQYYNDIATRYDIETLLRETGIYYTAREVRTFLDRMSERGSDLTNTSSFKGLYVSSEKIMLCFVSEPHADNKLVKVNTAPTKRTISVIQGYFSKITHVFETISTQELEYTGKVDAVVISESELLAPKMVKHRNSSLPGLLAGGTELFDRLFLIPMSQSGLDCLDYICHRSVNRWYEEATEFFTTNDAFFVTPSTSRKSKAYIGAEEIDDRLQPAVYMPVYEINELSRIADMREPVTIVTYAEMAEVIARCLAKQTSIYGILQGERIPTYTYNSDGKKAGEAKLKAELKKLGYDPKLILTKDLLNKFAEEFGSLMVFYNGINEDDNKVRQVAEYLTSGEQPTLLETTATPVKKSKPHRITLQFSEENYLYIKGAAKLYGISPSRYIMQLVRPTLIPQAKKDAAEYLKKVKESRAFNKKNM